MLNIEEIFEKHENEYLRFEEIENPICQRPDLCAFIKLDELIPGDMDIIRSAEHDEIWIGITIEALSGVATEEDILFLVRCGVRLSDGYLAMFV